MWDCHKRILNGLSYHLHLISITASLLKEQLIGRFKAFKLIYYPSTSGGSIVFFLNSDSTTSDASSINLI
jgi:hypothetical protein